MAKAIGNPDYQRYSQWRGQFQSGSSVSVTSSKSLTVNQQVTNYASTLLSVTMNSGTGVTVEIHFYTDAAMGTELGAWTYVLVPNTALNVILPNIGNYLQFVVATSESGTQDIDWATQLTNLAPARPSYPVPTNYEGNYGFGIGAGKNYTNLLPQVMEGAGRVTVNPHSGGSKMTLIVEELAEDGTVKGILQRSDNPGSPVSLQFLTGRNPVQVVIENNDTAAHDYDFSVSVQAC